MSESVQIGLRAACFALLAGDGTLAGLLGDGRLHDAPPGSQDYPYLVLETLESRPLLAELGDGAVHDMALSVFSRGPSRDEAAIAAERAVEVLVTGPLAIADNRLVNLTVTRIATRRLRDGRGFRAVCALRAVTEPLN